MNKKSSIRGASLLETAILLPLFLFGVLFVIWMATIFNAKSALTNSVSRGLRLAITRSDKQLVGGHTIEDLERFIEDGETSPRFWELLTNKVDPVTAENNYTQFNSGDSLRDLPPEYLYALVYTYEYMRPTISGEVLYPCDPALPTSLAPAGAGCLRCDFVGDRHKDEIGLECTFQPSHFLISPMVSMLRIILGEAAGPKLVLKRRLIYSVGDN